MDAEDVTKSIGIPHLNLDNFELAEPDSRYILTSPRSLQACQRCGVRPVELLRTPVEEFYNEYKDRNYLSRSDILDEFHLQEKVRIAKLSQCREERQRIVFLEAEEAAAIIPRFLDHKQPATIKSKPARPTKSPKKVAWDASTKGNAIPIRTPSVESGGSDALSSSPVRAHKSWVESLRSPDLTRRATSTPDLMRHATSTPVKAAVSSDDISVIGRTSSLSGRRKREPRSRSVPPSRRSASPGIDKADCVELERSYEQLEEAHMQLTSNITQLEQEFKALKVQQRKDEARQKKKTNIEALKLQKQTQIAASKTRNSRNKLKNASRTESGVSRYSLRQLHNMESERRAHLLRETQAHINELKTQIKQHKASRSARLIREDRESWENLVTTRQSRSLQRADIAARRRVRDVSAKARRMRQEKERSHSQNMRHIVQQEERQLLRNLDNIISKDKKVEYLQSERERMLAKCRQVSRRGPTRTPSSKSFDRMSREADLMARLESRGTNPRWK